VAATFSVACCLAKTVELYHQNVTSLFVNVVMEDKSESYLVAASGVNGAGGWGSWVYEKKTMYIA
jgi:hypothetical protein